jgi:hypothetical protein
MYCSSLVFPVLAGKTEAEIRSVADRFKTGPQGYFKSHRLCRNHLGTGVMKEFCDVS